MFFEITRIYQIIGFIRGANTNFETFHWKDKSRARELVNQGLHRIGQNPTVDNLQPIVSELFKLLPEPERAKVDSSLLTQ